ncbi:MAG TPA: family 16 glycosylhydrolase [Puia sp.]|nr:family 16 glycosylhydrolase [Puia sp.]
MKLVKLIPLLFWTITSCGKGNNDPGSATLPKLTFADVSVAEGNGGSGTVEIVLTLDHASSKAVSVSYSTVDGTAKSGADYTAVNGQTVTFQPNETEKKIQITVVADDIKEADETFSVRLSNPVNVTLQRETCTVTLKNDDSKVGFANTGYDAPTSYPGYTLAWSDEFNDTSLSTTDWSWESGDGCPGICNWGNNELEYYTAPPNNLFFQDGKMIIEARSEVFGGKNYTSTRIKTQGKKTFKYGRIDIRAILPTTKGLWPALWLLPQNNVYGNWPTSGEIDMMEEVGSEPGKVLGTAHYGPGPNSTYISRNYSLTGATFNDQFHVFSLEWQQDQLKWYVDNILYSTVTKADVGSNIYPYNEQFFLIVNLAVGGNLPGAPDASSIFPQWLILDYIRVYQQ